MACLCVQAMSSLHNHHQWPSLCPATSNGSIFGLGIAGTYRQSSMKEECDFDKDNGGKVGGYRVLYEMGKWVHCFELENSVIFYGYRMIEKGRIKVICGLKKRASSYNGMKEATIVKELECGREKMKEIDGDDYRSSSVKESVNGGMRGRN
ncbi:unnamed protein product [Dovyalis caffra]|uniref:Uncharacterized protein n=1 Tax=Dovyalis caffra TaxID=77055 RepID=A0AAV1SPC5_9ROSI|nr:unnamed protein product [Dovyalis caffra]